MSLFVSPHWIVLFILLKSLAPGTSRVSVEPWKVPAWADTLNHQQVDDPAWVALGRTIYTNECLICHGSAGRGDGESGFGLHVPPGDFCSPAVINETNGALYYKITVGRKPMPSYEEKLSENQRWQLVSYIRELQKKYIRRLNKKSK